MKMASELTKDQLEALVHRAQSVLWFDVRDGWNADWNPDKEWSGETIEIIAEAFADYGLKPSATPDADAVLARLGLTGDQWEALPETVKAALIEHFVE